MRVKKTLISLAVAVAAMLPAAAWAQTSSINAFSPYTMYGIGELNTQGTLPMRSMGGVGVANPTSGIINLLNPAAYSNMPRNSFLFDFGVEGQNYYNSQTVNGVGKKTSYNTFNFHDIAFQLPLAKKIGLGFSLTPYSSVGYRINTEHAATDDGILANVGRILYNYQGEGDVTEVKLGLGWEIFKNFSIGLAAQYYWGSIDRGAVMTPIPITGSGTYNSTLLSNNSSISSIKGQVGFQYSPILNRKRALTIGATYDFGGNLNPRITKSTIIGDLYNSVVTGDTTTLSLSVPRQLALGVFYQTPKISIGVDYVYQNWGGQNKETEMTGGAAPMTVAYTNTSTVKMGIEFTPDRYDVRRFLKRWSYRAGFRYGNYNQMYNNNTISQYAVTFGVGVPIKYRAISSIDIGFEYGRRGGNLAQNLGLVQQQYFKFAIGFTLFAGAENNEYWFLRPKFE